MIFKVIDSLTLLGFLLMCYITSCLEPFPVLLFGSIFIIFFNIFLTIALVSRKK